MFAINREEIRTEVEGELTRLEAQVGLGQKVRVMVVHPHRPPIVDWVGTDYASMYCTLGGPPERVALEEGVDLYCNEYGKLLGLTANRALFVGEEERPWDVVAGTFLVMGADEGTGDQIDLTDEALKKYSKIFEDPICRWGYRP
jgi:hypothetical protein